MAANTVLNQGAKLEINTSGTTYIQIKGFTDWSGLGGGSAQVIDTTDLDSVAKEKGMGLADEGQVSANFLFLPKDAGQLALRAARGTRAATKMRLTLIDGTKYDWTGFVLTFERSGAADDVIKASANIEITGPVTETAAA